jgi:hypothetical protein
LTSFQVHISLVHDSASYLLDGIDLVGLQRGIIGHIVVILLVTVIHCIVVRISRRVNPVQVCFIRAGLGHSF